MAIMKRLPRRATRIKLETAPIPQCWWPATEWTGQKCNFCEETPRAAGGGFTLRKYGTRNYICDECLAQVLDAPPQSYRT
jgi:hypothetical protein